MQWSGNFGSTEAGSMENEVKASMEAHEMHAMKQRPHESSLEMKWEENVDKEHLHCIVEGTSLFIASMPKTSKIVVHL